MHVDDDHRRALLGFVDELVDHLERTDGRSEEERTEQVDHGDLRLVAGRDECEPSARSALRHVRRPDHALALLQVRNDLAATPGVVAEGDRVDAGGEHLVGELGRDADAVREVFAVEDAEIRAQLLAKRGEALFDGATAGHADRIRNEQNSHRRILAGLPSEAKV